MGSFPITPASFRRKVFRGLTDETGDVKRRARVLPFSGG